MVLPWPGQCREICSPRRQAGGGWRGGKGRQEMPPPRATPATGKGCRVSSKQGVPHPCKCEPQRKSLQVKDIPKRKWVLGGRGRLCMEGKGHASTRDWLYTRDGAIYAQDLIQPPKKQSCKVVLLLPFCRRGNGGQGDSVTCPRGCDQKSQELAFEPDPHPALFFECCTWDTIC